MVTKMEKVVIIEKATKPLYKRVLSHPFRYYTRAAGFTFCLVSGTNLGTTLFDDGRRKFLHQFPQLYFFGLLYKSSFFGLVWPAFYITAVRDWREAFIYGGGLEKIGQNKKDR